MVAALFKLYENTDNNHTSKDIKEKGKSKKSTALGIFSKETRPSNLQLGHGDNVNRLDPLLTIFLDLLLDIILNGDLVILNNNVDLQLLDTETNIDETVRTPHQTVHLDALDELQHGFKIGLVIPWLNIDGNKRLGGSLWLTSLLSLVCGNSLSLELLSFGIFLFVIIEKIDIIIIFFFIGCSSWSLTCWQSLELLGERSDVVEPSGEAWVSFLEGLVGGNISLGGRGTRANGWLLVLLKRNGFSKIQILTRTI